MAAKSFVDPDLLANKKHWREYFEAKVGFRNYWYPACFSHEVLEGEVITRTILGEGMLLRRVRGQVRAIRDRCIHRGVKFSDKVECYTPDTISCWYHGFTFRWNDGVVCSIFGAPESSAVGTRHVKTYPVQEAKGMVFVFVGDADFQIPPLAYDVPPGFLDENTALEGESIIVRANWRLGPEGGIDEIHRYLHRDSPLLVNTSKSMPLGHAAARDQFELVERPDGPKGVIDHFKAEKMFFDGQIDGKTVVKGPNFGPTGRRPVYSSAWLPSCVKVVGFPDEGITLFEWYVPIDEVTHRCFMTLSKPCNLAGDAAEFKEAFKLRWKPLGLDGFLMQDVRARESQQQFYAHDRAWLEEGLVEDDFMLMQWRKLCSRHSRGVQTPDHLV
ncbi:MAG: Rieske 2Fe-2S domain-containing protein [Steroidobacteraceae bacterium]